MGITKKFYGKTAEGKVVDIFTLRNNNGMMAEILNYGGIITSLRVPDKDGKFDDVVLGYDNFEDYLKNRFFFGAIVGRHANRIENASFEINGILYKVTKNEGENQLHGGVIGFDKVVWEAEIIKKEKTNVFSFVILAKMEKKAIQEI